MKTVYRERGADEMIERDHKASGRFDAVFRKMMALPIHTMAGAAVMARATVIAGLLSHYWSEPIEDMDWEPKCIRSLIERLCARAGVPLPAIEGGSLS